MEALRPDLESRFNHMRLQSNVVIVDSLFDSQVISFVPSFKD